MAVKNKKTKKRASTQSMIPIGEIRNNSVLLKEGGIRGVLKVSTINLNLKTEEEQNATLVAYQQFLNTIEFPIQISIQSRKVDLDSYFKLLETQESVIENPLLKSQTHDYREYLQKISEYSDIMEKKFFVVVPAEPSRRETKGNFLSQFLENMSPEDSLDKVKKRYHEFKSLSSTLQKRIDIVSSGLERCGLNVQRLNNQELITLYYQSYNPSLSQSQKVENASLYNII